MPYLNIDDNFAEHPKVDRLSDGAFRLHVAGLCYAAKHRTNGLLTAERVPRLVPRFRPVQLTELIEGCVWEHHVGGYQIHDFLDWNKSREWWGTKRRADAERLAKWRAEQAANAVGNEG